MKDMHFRLDAYIDRGDPLTPMSFVAQTEDVSFIAGGTKVTVGSHIAYRNCSVRRSVPLFKSHRLPSQHLTEGSNLHQIFVLALLTPWRAFEDMVSSGSDASSAYEQFLEGADEKMHQAIGYLNYLSDVYDKKN